MNQNYTWYPNKKISKIGLVGEGEQIENTVR